MELKVREQIEDTDVLIIGGGIAGLQAAIEAGRLMLKYWLQKKPMLDVQGMVAQAMTIFCVIFQAYMVMI